ncbi:hypothetical protein [Actinophytocola oryzae]|uniref:hypothetical protein n=1 Tax=Actinophytocola oryzae TaxID=502181 RepID=UPI00106434EA|nr:hypothetical protein [Actinophytocola oryzae]
MTHAVPGDAPTGSAASVASAPVRFDPLVRFASFGWLPEDRMNSRFTTVHDVGFSTGVWEYVPDPSKGPFASLPAASVGVTLYSAGHTPETELPLEVWGPPDSPPGSHAPVTTAPPVNGAPAYWVTVPGEPEKIILKWRYAPNGWAEVTVSRLNGDLHRIAHRVARELRVGGTERLRFPFHLTGLPTGLRPVMSTIREGGLPGPWEGELLLATSRDNRGMNLGVSVQPMTPGDRHPNTTVDGYQANREIVVGDDGQTVVSGAQYADLLTVYDVSGLQTGIRVDAQSAAEVAPLGPDGSVSVFRGMTVHPDRADWTDRPLR